MSKSINAFEAEKKINAAGYRVRRFGTGAACTLQDQDGAFLMIGSHGQVAPTRWEAIKEALDRMAFDARMARDLELAADGFVTAGTAIAWLEAGTADAKIMRWAADTLRAISDQHPEILDLGEAEVEINREGYGQVVASWPAKIAVVERAVVLDLDVVYSDDMDLEETIKALTDGLDVQTEVINDQGPGGWPIVRFSGSAPGLDKLRSRYNGDDV